MGYPFGCSLNLVFSGWVKLWTRGSGWSEVEQVLQSDGDYQGLSCFCDGAVVFLCQGFGGGWVFPWMRSSSLEGGGRGRGEALHS
jgi:hypothetical protein